MKASNLEHAITVWRALKHARDVQTKAMTWMEAHITVELVGRSLYLERSLVEVMLAAEVERLEKKLASMGVEE